LACPSIPASLGWRLGGARYTDDAFGIADEATALAGLRIGRDRGYWSTVRAGAGPFVAMTYRTSAGPTSGASRSAASCGAATDPRVPGAATSGYERR